MSGFEHTARRPPGETRTGPVRVMPPPGPVVAATDEASPRRRIRPSGGRTIAVAGLHGGVGTTTVVAGVAAELGVRLGSGIALADHVGGVLLSRVPEAATPGPSSPLVADIGAHALGDADVLARTGDVVVIVSPLTAESAAAADAARRAVVERRSGDGGSAVLVLVEARPSSGRRRRHGAEAAGGSARTIVLRWDPALADRRVVRIDELSEESRASLAALCDAIVL